VFGICINHSITARLSAGGSGNSNAARPAVELFTATPGRSLISVRQQLIELTLRAPPASAHDAQRAPKRVEGL
jgi:hypothetical protein